MKICIIEDEEIWRNKIKMIIEKHCKDKDILYEINSYGNESEFMENAEADLLFLDIELAEGGDGFRIAERLMSSGSQSKICFLTSHIELARLGYRVNAFRYIDKRHLEEIDEALDFFFKTKIQEKVIYRYDTTGGCRKIELNNLLLIETNGRKLRYLMLEGKEFLCEGKISETAQELSQVGFFQIQRSYIVNMKFIIKTNSREILLCNGQKIVIGRAHSKEFKKQFLKWRMIFDS